MVPLTMLSGFFSSKLGMKVGIGLIAIALFCSYTYLVYDYASDVTEDKKELEFKESLEEHNKLVRSKELKILQLKEDLAMARDEASKLNDKIGEEYETKLFNQKNEYDNIIASLESDNIRLQIDLRSNRESNNSTDSNTARTEGSCDAKKTAYLPKETSRFLVEQAREADEIVYQLTACQSTINLYQSKIKEYNLKIGKLNNESGNGVDGR